ncbi:MAG: radical SAM protein [Candidatus Margulisiibacteriota bacterium]
MADSYYLYFNITYQCNCRCGFCAANLTAHSDKNQINFKTFTAIIEKYPHGEATLVTINGGEPTLHQELAQILTLLKKRGNPVHLFTNGRRFTSVKFALSILNVLAGTILIPIYGTKPAIHDSFTGIKGSFEETFQGLQNIYRFKLKDSKIQLRLKLLFARPLLKENEKVARFVLQNFPETDILSLHSLIISDIVKKNKQFIPAKNKLKSSINATLATIKNSPYPLSRVNISDLPPCLISEDNRVFLSLKKSQNAKQRKFIYYDPYFLSGNPAQARDVQTCFNCQKCRQNNHCHFLK